MAKANPLKKITARAKQIAKATGKSWQQAIKQAGKEYRSGKIGATLLIEKGETKRTKPSRVIQVSRTKSGTFKGSRQISGHPGFHQKFKSISDVKKANAEIGQNWFSASTMKFWRIQIASPLINGRYFITKDPDMHGKDPRFTIRKALPTGWIRTEGDFRQYPDFVKARNALMKIIANEKFDLNDPYHVPGMLPYKKK